MNDENTFVLRCERITSDKPTLNGNIYSREVLEQMVESARGRIAQRTLLGRLGTSADLIRLMDASHIVTALEVTKDGHLSAQIEVVNTEHGQALTRMLAGEGISNMEIVPFGSGSVTQINAATRSVGLDYHLSAIDVVSKRVPVVGEVAPKTSKAPAGRTTTIRIPIAVDEQGNCYSVGWLHAKSEYPDPGYGDMEEQARECHFTSFQEEAAQTVVVRWVTVEVPLAESSSEVEGIAQVEEAEDEADG